MLKKGHLNLKIIYFFIYRVFSVGIGEGASTALVKGIARAGKGKYEMVTGTERLQQKVCLIDFWNRLCIWHTNINFLDRILFSLYLYCQMFFFKIVLLCVLFSISTVIGLIRTLLINKNCHLICIDVLSAWLFCHWW